MVCKDMVVDYDVQWRNPSFWRAKLPREIHTHLIEETRAKNPQQSQHSHRNLIRFRSYRLAMDQRRFRLYLDLCSEVDLGKAMFARAETDHSVLRLPERFLWYVFQELVNGCFTLWQGGDYEGTETQPKTRQGWKPMVYSDLHISNVFLDRRDPENGSGPPTVSVFLSAKTVETPR